MSPVWPRQLAHRGTVQATGLWMEQAWVPPAQARRRALDLWEPGARLYGFPEGLLLLWASPRPIDARRSLGAPLVKQGPWFCAAPLAEDELRALRGPPGAVVLVRAGLAVLLSLEEGAWLDPAAWLALDPLVHALKPLARPPAPPVLPPAAPALRLRTQLGLEQAEVAQQRQQLAQALRRAQEDPPAPLPAEKQEEAAPVAQAPGWWRSLERWISSRAPTPEGSPRSAPAPSTSEPRALVRVRRPRQREASLGLWARLRRWWGQTAQPPRRDQAWELALGQQQSRFLQETLDLFQQGELREALLRAIPLSSEGGPTQRAPGRGTPLAPRSELSISPKRGGSGGSVVTPLYERLRQAYREAQRRLVEEGRIEEAAFILLELLGEDEEGLQLLEQHERWEMALEVAQARHFPPGHQAWLCLRADRWGAALELARRFGCFADVSARLRLQAASASDATPWTEMDHKWRLLWAHTLAQGGDFARAVALAWELEEGRRLALAWNERLVALGGEAGGRALARKLQVSSQPYAQQAWEGAWALVRSPDPQRLSEQRGFLEGVLAGPHELVRPLLEVAPRLALQNAARTGQAQDAALWRRSLRACPDKLLVADMEGVQLSSRAPWGPAHEPRIYAAHDAGTLEPYAVVRGAGEVFLLALGEAGMLLVDAQGQELARFPQAATWLVGSTAGTRALALTRRGELHQIHVVDLEARTCRPWCRMRLSAWAPLFDGMLWLVAQEDAVLALDALALREPALALWRAPQLGGQVQRLAWSGKEWSALLRSSDPPRAAVMRFSWPAMVPEDRREHMLHSSANALTPDGGLLALRLGAEELELRLDGGRIQSNPQLKLPAPLGARDPQVFSGHPGVVVVVVYTQGSAWLWFLDRQDRTARAHLVLKGAQRVALALDPGGVLVVDDRGRLLAWDARQREVSQELRL